MLKKCSPQFSGQWDEALHLILFAFREIPSEATGYPPFTLMFGRDVRGPLHLLRESWEAPNTKKVTVVKYLEDLKDKFATIQHDKSLLEGRKKQESKKRYDTNAISREYEEGGSVWLMEPDATTKMKMKWKGPFQVTKKIYPLNYVIDMDGRQRTTHINQLKKNHPPYLVHQIGVSLVEVDDGDIETWTNREDSTTTPVLCLSQGFVGHRYIVVKSY